MSLGSIFLPPERRLKSDIHKLHRELIEEDIRNGIVNPDRALHDLTQRLGRLYNTAPDDPKIFSTTIHSRNGVCKSTSTVAERIPNGQNQNVTFPPLTATILSSTHTHGGKYEVTNTFNPYQPAIQATVSHSEFNMNTPKLWPNPQSYDCYASSKFQENEKYFTSSPLVSDRPCSKSHTLLPPSIRVSKTSALQQTLYECGKLKRGNILKETELDDKAENALQHHRNTLRTHIRWLDDEKDLIFPTGNRSETFNHSSDRSVSSISALSGTEHSLPRNTVHTTLRAPSLENSANVFRKGRVHHTRKVKHCRKLPKSLNSIDPMDYKAEMTVQNLTSFNACVQPKIGILHVPSQNEVTSILVQLTRKQIMCYQTRVIESARLVKALKDAKHVTPGFQAIIALHHDFVRTASVNINPQLLSKSQIQSIVQNHVPWLDGKSVGRLLTSYDTTNTGIIRFVRISSTLVCCFEPAMIKLASALDNNNKKWSNYYISNDSIELGRLPKSQRSASTSSDLSRNGKSQRSILDMLSSEDTLTEGEWRDFRGEIFVIRLLHKMFCDSSGYLGLENSQSQPVVARMKLEDVREMFTCCVTSTDEENKMDIIIGPMVQYLMVQLSKELVGIDPNVRGNIGTDPVLATTVRVDKVMKYGGLKSLFSQLTLDEEMLVDAVLVHPNVLREFISQVRKFRKESQSNVHNLN